MKTADGYVVTGPLIMGKAKEFYNLMELKEPSGLSISWLQKFKKRHGIKKLNVVKTKSADTESIVDFVNKFHELIVIQITYSELRQCIDDGLFM